MGEEKKMGDGLAAHMSNHNISNFPFLLPTRKKKKEGGELLAKEGGELLAYRW